MACLRWPRLSLSLLVLGTLRANADAATDQSNCLAEVPGHAPDCATDAVPSRASEPALALADQYEPGTDLKQYLVSEKLDGVRAYWDGRRLITRGGLVVNAPAWFTAGFPAVPLDGELWMGRRSFAQVSGAVRRLQPELADWQRIRYALFDLPAMKGDFQQRLDELRRLVAASPSPHLKLIDQTQVDDHDALMALLERVVAGGGEGLMLHHRQAPYRAGRSDDLQKVKPYLEGEARVIEHLPGRGKFHDMLGSLLVQEIDGDRFRIGSGFSDAERADPPAIGSIVTFKYHGRTKNGLPRFASFLRMAEQP
ncbi:MAG: DNA ligase [Thiohalocapsa sp.]